MINDPQKFSEMALDLNRSLLNEAEAFKGLKVEIVSDIIGGFFHGIKGQIWEIGHVKIDAQRGLLVALEEHPIGCPLLETKDYRLVE